MPNSPQRYLANNRNRVLDAILTPSSVLAVEDQVLSLAVAREGTAEVRLSGAFEGVEEATYDVEIVDTTPDDPIVSAPVFSGTGSARLVDVAATAVDAQTITVELVDAGKPATYAAVSFEGVTLKARAIGSGGNSIRIAIDQSGLTFEETDYALLVDLKAGQGGPNGGLEGVGFDWDTAVLGADDLIPTTAHRVAFGDDRSTVYLAYKRYVDNKWLYHFVPELRRDVPKGTPVLFVTGGREVTIGDSGSPDETYSNVVTVYDLLSAIRTGSSLLAVDGVVTNDRSPRGQAARELLVRTDAHVQPSTGSGSAAATGMVDTFANSTARTELVVAKCFAVRGADHPLARLGAERWEVSTSLGGVIGTAVTDVAFVDPDGRFGFTIPQRLPIGYGTQRGRFELVQINYQTRDEGVENTPICPVSLRLGPEATDQQITLRWTKRPSGDCDCSDLPKPFIGGTCLGIIEEGGNTDMTYSAANRARLIDLYEWFTETVRDNSYMSELGPGTGDDVVGQEPFLTDPGSTTGFRALSLRDIVKRFEEALAQINDLTEGESPDLRADAETAWDAAVVELKADIDPLSASSPGTYPAAVLSDRYLARLDAVLITGGISPLGKSDASIIESGDGCWRDWGDTHYWTVEGSAKGGYAPAFVNRPYYSSRRADTEGRYYATHEFGFQINVAPDCVADLIEGDEVILTIGDAGYAATYQVGDTLTLPVVAAQSLFLAGGRDDDAEQTWSVTGDVDGPFAPWQFVPGESPTAYADGGLSWDIEPGGIDNAKGDKFTFAIEGGHFRYRKDGGAWSSSIGIPVGSIALADGLSIEFVPGAAPSFVEGDVHSFRALQPWAVSNVESPSASRWRWADGDSPGPSLDVDLGAVYDLDMIALALHTIPSGATITLEGGDAAAGEWSEPVTWRAGLIVQPFTVARTARYLRLSLTDADGGGIGWLWCGEALSTTLSAEVQRRSTFRISRGDGPLNPGGASLGNARGADVVWREGALSADDADAVVAMFEWCKGADDEPLIVLPHIDRPGDAILGRIEVDELEFSEVSGENRNDSDARRYGLTLPVQGFLR
jgi:hypothetical protein